MRGGSASGLSTVSQEGVGQHAGDHRLDHRHGAQADARVVTPLGAQLDLLAGFVDRAARGEDRGCRLDERHVRAGWNRRFLLRSKNCFRRIDLFVVDQTMPLFDWREDWKNECFGSPNGEASCQTLCG